MYRETERTKQTPDLSLSLVSESTMTALQYLESQRNAHPEMAEWYNALADLYQRKLWHQLTLKLEQFVAHAVSQVFQFHSSFFWFSLFGPMCMYVVLQLLRVLDFC